MFVIAAVGMEPQFTDRCHPPPKTPGGCTLSSASLTEHPRNKELIGDTSHLLDHGKCPPEVDNSRGAMSQKHLKAEWSREEIADAVRDNVVGMNWNNNATRSDVPLFVKSDGVYLYDADGKQYIDMTSQAVCANMGYTVDEDVIGAIVQQLRTVPYVYPGLGMCEIRARLSNLMAEITPGDLNGFVFPLGGSEANEIAIRLARRYTGKFKVLTASRSYHGGTSAALGATGDFRTRFAGEQPGFVRISGPHPLCFSRGETDEEAAAQSLMALEEQIIIEGPEQIASIMLEPIMRPAGVLVQPVGYLEGVRALCDKCEILLHVDEVMTGFWRTGTLFAFMHFRGVVPDLLTSSKGLTSSILPLGIVGMRQKLMDHFETHAFGWSATWGNHPVLMASAYELLRKSCCTNMKTASRRFIMFEIRWRASCRSTVVCTRRASLVRSVAWIWHHACRILHLGGGGLSAASGAWI